MRSKLKIIWLQGVTCNANTHSFLNHPSLTNVLKKVEFLYHPLLRSTYSLQELTQELPKSDIIIFEGSFDRTLKRVDRSLWELFSTLQKNTSHIIATGTCASYGGILKSSNPKHSSGLVFDGKKEVNDIIDTRSKLINLPGCPIHPEWLGYLLEMLYYNHPIPLDDEYRPLELYAPLTHHGCDRNEYFEWKVDAKNFGEKEGCLYYEQGCRGVLTHSSCNKILWNEVSSKTRAGTPCFGCTEADFPRENLFSTKTNMSIPEEVPLGVPKRAYLTMAGIAKTFHIKRLEGKLIDYQKNNRKD